MCGLYLWEPIPFLKGKKEWIWGRGDVELGELGGEQGGETEDRMNYKRE